MDNLYIVKEVYEDMQDGKEYMLLTGLMEYRDGEFPLAISHSLKTNCCKEFCPKVGDIVKIQPENDNSWLVTLIQSMCSIQN